MSTDPPADEPMTPDDTDTTAEGDALLAAYALDAVEVHDVALVEALLSASPSAAAEEASFRQAGAEYAAVVLPSTADVAGFEPPPLDLRDRVLAAAIQRRRPARIASGSPASVHRIEAQRLITTARTLRPADWARPMGPPEFAGWTVHDAFAHITASEGLFAQLLGIDVPAVPETEIGSVERTAAAQVRHRTMSPARSIVEYEALAAAIDAKVSTMTDAELEQEIEWWGAPMQISAVLVHRGFETWTHHDDIRRAAGLAPAPPPPDSLAAMSTRACEWVPFFLATVDAVHEGETARIVLTGEGGGSHLVTLGFDPVAAPSEPVFELRMDVVDFCRAIANRVPAEGYPMEIGGDEAKARALVSALPNLAGL